MTGLFIAFVLRKENLCVHLSVVFTSLVIRARADKYPCLFRVNSDCTFLHFPVLEGLNMLYFISFNNNSIYDELGFSSVMWETVMAYCIYLQAWNQALLCFCLASLFKHQRPPFHSCLRCVKLTSFFWFQSAVDYRWLIQLNSIMYLHCAKSRDIARGQTTQAIPQGPELEAAPQRWLTLVQWHNLKPT